MKKEEIWLIYGQHKLVKDSYLNQLNCEFEKSTVQNVSPLLMVQRGIRYLKPKRNDETMLEVFAFKDSGACGTIRIPYSIFTKKELMILELSKYGVYPNINYISHLQRYLNNEVRQMQATDPDFDVCLTRELGWQDIPNEYDRKFILGSDKAGGENIEYYDKSILFQNGSLEGQVEFIKTEVIPYPETQLALTLGLASVISGYIEPYLNTRFIGG